MANLKSAKKRILIAERNRQKNRWYKSGIKNLVRTAMLAVSSKKQEAVICVRDAISLMDKAASKNVISKSRASRKKSQLMKLLKTAA